MQGLYSLILSLFIIFSSSSIAQLVLASWSVTFHLFFSLIFLTLSLQPTSFLFILSLKSGSRSLQFFLFFAPTNPLIYSSILCFLLFSCAITRTWVNFALSSHATVFKKKSFVSLSKIPNTKSNIGSFKKGSWKGHFCRAVHLLFKFKIWRVCKVHCARNLIKIWLVYIHFYASYKQIRICILKIFF